MNNKILLGILVVLLLVGGGLLFLTFRGNQPAQEQTTTTQTTQTEIVPTTSFDQEQQVRVILTENGFEPKTATIKTGTRVIWINDSETMATVNSAEHPTHEVYPPLNLGQFDPGLSLQLVFDKPGTYTYHDHFHPERIGTIIVE